MKLWAWLTRSLGVMCPGGVHGKGTQTRVRKQQQVNKHTCSGEASEANCVSLEERRQCSKTGKSNGHRRFVLGTFYNFVSRSILSFLTESSAPARPTSARIGHFEVRARRAGDGNWRESAVTVCS